jgi:hypothetical protein
MIEKTAKKLSVSEENIFYDDRPNGGDPLYTAKKAYLSDCGNATHLICLQDDVEVCNNFKEICNKIITMHPDKVISLFPFNYLKQTEELDNLKSPYIKTFLVSGQGIIMPTKYIKSCFEWIDEVFDGKGADDYAIQR